MDSNSDTENDKIRRLRDAGRELIEEGRSFVDHQAWLERPWLELAWICRKFFQRG